MLTLPIQDNIYHQKQLMSLLPLSRIPKFPKFDEIFVPTCLFHPTNLLETLEYKVLDAIIRILSQKFFFGCSKAETIYWIGKN